MGEFEGPEAATGVKSGDELARVRENRPTPVRFAHIEGRVDDVVQSVTEWRIETAEQFGGVNSSLGELAGEVKGLATVVSNMAQRGDIVFRSQTEVGTAKELDKIDAKKNRREFWTKIVIGAVGGGGVLEVLHRIFG